MKTIASLLGLLIAGSAIADDLTHIAGGTAYDRKTAADGCRKSKNFRTLGKEKHLLPGQTILIRPGPGLTTKVYCDLSAYSPISTTCSLTYDHKKMKYEVRRASYQQNARNKINERIVMTADFIEATQVLQDAQLGGECASLASIRSSTQAMPMVPSDIGRGAYDACFYYYYYNSQGNMIRMNPGQKAVEVRSRQYALIQCGPPVQKACLVRKGAIGNAAHWFVKPEEHKVSGIRTADTLYAALAITAKLPKIAPHVPTMKALMTMKVTGQSMLKSDPMRPELAKEYLAGVDLYKRAHAKLKEVTEQRLSEASKASYAEAIKARYRLMDLGICFGASPKGWNKKK
jgi:hypothetical protein